MGLQDHLYTLDVCLFVPNKYQNGRTDRAQILCGTSFDQREGYEYLMNIFMKSAFFLAAVLQYKKKMFN